MKGIFINLNKICIKKLIKLQIRIIIYLHNYYESCSSHCSLNFLVLYDYLSGLWDFSIVALLFLDIKIMTFLSIFWDTITQK